MRFLLFLAVLLILASMGLGYFAVVQFDSASTAESKNASLRLENQRLQAELTELKSDAYADPIQVKFAADALSDFYMRLMEAGEVLGAGVRIAPGAGGGSGGTPQFAVVKYGVQVAPVVVDAAALTSAAPALFAMLWEELEALPVSVKKISARPQGGVIALQLEVDIFGR